MELCRELDLYLARVVTCQFKTVGLDVAEFRASKVVRRRERQAEIAQAREQATISLGNAVSHAVSVMLAMFGWCPFQDECTDLRAVLVIMHRSIHDNF